MKRWTAGEKAYLEQHWQDRTDKELARHFHCHPSQVATQRHRMKLCRSRTQPTERKAWTPEEDGYLSEAWGSVSVAGLTKKLGRTESAVLNRARRLGLGAFLESGEYVSLNQLLNVVTGSRYHQYYLESWVEKRGLPIHTKRRLADTVRVVYLEEFWKWAEKNKSFIDFSKMEPLALGEEPSWVAEQRKKDHVAFALQRKDPWTPEDDSRLISLLKQQRYGYAELSEMLRRSAGAIQRRCTDLGLKERPVRADNHGKSAVWAEDDYQILAEGIRHGDSYTAIARAVGKSEKAVRGKVYFTYLTENADKVRAMLGAGSWGDGAPVPTVGQGIHLSRTRAAVRKDLSDLAGLLTYRSAEMRYDPYWQRQMCQYGDGAGCTIGEKNCDECVRFQRILQKGA